MQSWDLNTHSPPSVGVAFVPLIVMAEPGELFGELALASPNRPLLRINDTLVLHHGLFIQHK